MESETAVVSVRENLRNLVAEPRTSEMFSGFARLPTAPNSRTAAVLILFGVLDDVFSARKAVHSSVPRNLDLLLLARADSLRSHPGQIAFPGGRVDDGDAGPIEAAVREAEEETGLDPAGVEVLGTLPTVPLAHSQHLVTPVLAWWDRPSRVGVVDPAESSAVFRAPVTELLDPANRGVTILDRDGQIWRGPAFRVPHVDGDRLVWGFTAIVLDGLFTALGWSEQWDHDRVFAL